MTDTRRKDVNWTLNVNENGTVPHQDAELAVLMDIRDELKRLNQRLWCPNVGEIPYLLREIRKFTRRIPAPKKHKRRKARR